MPPTSQVAKDLASAKYGRDYNVGDRVSVRWPILDGSIARFVAVISERKSKWPRRTRSKLSRHKYLLRWADGSDERWSRLAHLTPTVLYNEATCGARDAQYLWSDDSETGYRGVLKVCAAVCPQMFALRLTRGVLKTSGQQGGRPPPRPEVFWTGFTVSESEAGEFGEGGEGGEGESGGGTALTAAGQPAHTYQAHCNQPACQMVKGACVLGTFDSAAKAAAAFADHTREQHAESWAMFSDEHSIRVRVESEGASVPDAGLPTGKGSSGFKGVSEEKGNAYPVGSERFMIRCVTCQPKKRLVSGFGAFKTAREAAVGYKFHCELAKHE